LTIAKYQSAKCAHSARREKKSKAF